MKYLFCLLCLIFSISAKSQIWRNVENENLKILFPKNSFDTTVAQRGLTVHAKTYEDSNAIYYFTQIGCSDEDAKAAKEFLQGVLIGELKSTKGRIISKKFSNDLGILSLDAIYETDLPNLQLTHKSRHFIVGSKAYVIRFSYAKGNEKNVVHLENKLLKSIVIKKTIN